MSELRNQSTSVIKAMTAVCDEASKQWLITGNPKFKEIYDNQVAEIIKLKEEILSQEQS